MLTNSQLHEHEPNRPFCSLGKENSVFVFVFVDREPYMSTRDTGLWSKMCVGYNRKNLCTVLGWISRCVRERLGAGQLLVRVRSVLKLHPTRTRDSRTSKSLCTSPTRFISGRT